MEESATYKVIFNEGFEIGLKQGMDVPRTVARKMLKKGYSIDDIMEVTDLTLEQVQMLQAELVD